MRVSAECIRQCEMVRSSRLVQGLAARRLQVQNVWQGRKESNLRMLESKSSALTSLATPLHGSTSISFGVKRLPKISTNLLPTQKEGEAPDCCTCELASPRGHSPVQRRAALPQKPHFRSRSFGLKVRGLRASRWHRKPPGKAVEQPAAGRCGQRRNSNYRSLNLRLRHLQQSPRL